MTYVVTVRNAGPTDDPGPVTVSDTLPAALQPVGATGDGWACATAGQVVTCTRSSGLAKGASSELQLVEARLLVGVPVGEHRHGEHAVGGHRPDQQHRHRPAPVRALADPAISKRVRPPAPAGRGCHGLARTGRRGFFLGLGLPPLLGGAGALCLGRRRDDEA